MALTPDSVAQAEMGVRLRQVREALGLTQSDMGDVMGVGVSTISGWEGARNQIDLVKLAKAARRFGFTTDWIALGDVAGIRKDLADKLQAIISGESGGKKRGRPRGGSILGPEGPKSGPVTTAVTPGCATPIPLDVVRKSRSISKQRA